jgi:hypothetical protein
VAGGKKWLYNVRKRGKQIRILIYIPLFPLAITEILAFAGIKMPINVMAENSG